MRIDPTSTVWTLFVSEHGDLLEVCGQAQRRVNTAGKDALVARLRQVARKAQSWADAIDGAGLVAQRPASRTSGPDCHCH